jgi:hypothetical protein
VPGRWGTGRERDARLRELFYAARAEGLFGPANDVLVKFLSDLFSSFRRKFPDPMAQRVLEESEWIGRAWRILAEMPDEDRDDPARNLCAWLREAVERKINNLVLGAKHGLSEEQVQSSELVLVREHFRLKGEDSVLDRSADFIELEDSKAAISRGSFGSSRVWDHLDSLWVSLAWPPETSMESVIAVEKRLARVRTERGRASVSELARELPKEVKERRMGTAVAEFVLAPYGFVSSLAAGEPVEVALRIPTVREALPGLIWREPGTGSLSRNRLS